MAKNQNEFCGLVVNHGEPIFILTKQSAWWRIAGHGPFTNWLHNPESAARASGIAAEAFPGTTWRRNKNPGRTP